MDSERLIHSLKTVIAVLIGFSLTRVISFPYEQWIIITILVVMCAQIYVGSVFQKASIRFLGTLCGCLLALVNIELFHSTLWSILATLIIASLVFSYIATSSHDSLSYFSTMGCVTLAIILLGRRDPSLEFAAARFLEISVGLFIATLVSQFVFPIHARTHLRRTQAETLAQLRDFYHKTLLTHLVEVQTIDHHDLDEAIVKSLLKQRKLAKESGMEPLGTPFSANQVDQLLFCERQILRAINFMHIAQEKIQLTDLPEALFLRLKIFHEEVLAALDMLVKSVAEKKQKPLSLTLPTLDNMHRLRADYEGDITFPTIFYLDALIFNAEIIVEGIRLLGNLYTLGAEA